jgi:hypothetical protein
MTLKDALSLIFERFNFFETLWNIYILVTSGLLGLLASNRAALTRPIRLVATAAFLVFTGSHFCGILVVTKQWKALVNLASSLDTEKALPQLNAWWFFPPPLWGIVSFYIAMTAFVIAGIWCLAALSVPQRKGHESRVA